MSMPKGFKSEGGYATVSAEYDGNDYRTIAEIMTERGDKMNHATARNVFLRAMKKLAEPLCGLYGVTDISQIDKTARDPRFQESMIEMFNDMNVCSHKEDDDGSKIMVG